MTLKSCAAINNEGHPSKRGALQVIKTELFLWSNEKSPQLFTAAISILVDLIGIEPTTLRMRTVRSRKVVSFLPMDCGVWFDENDRRGAIKNTAFSVPIRN